VIFANDFLSFINKIKEAAFFELKYFALCMVFVEGSYLVVIKS